MFRKSLRFAAALVFVAVLAASCLAAEESRDNLYSWTASAGGRLVRLPFTTRYATHGKYMIIGDTQYSAAAGFKILDRGGNAFDAAVGMAAVMGITFPGMNDFFGGDAMIIIYSAKDNKLITYNGSGWAPKKATIDAYIDAGVTGIPDHGILSVEIPGSFSGWMTLLRDYGTMKLGDILEPAMDLADNGYFLAQVPSANVWKNMNDEAKLIYGAVEAERKTFGSQLKNPHYAQLLREVADAAGKGGDLKDGYAAAEDYFYRGPIAKEIAAFSKESGGFIEYEDLADFRAEKTEPHSTSFRGIDVYVCPPNSQGWVLLEALNLIEGYDLEGMGYNSAAYIDVIAQALNLALQDRNHFMADPRFHKNPMAMIGKKYAEERRKDMHPGSAMDGELTVGSPTDADKFGDVTYGTQGDTTFMAVADAEGNIVACTTSLCTAFGSALMVPNRGFMLNSRMSYFFLDKDLANFLEPRKRTIQTITPSIAMKDGKPFLAFGTPGADVQEQAKIQVFLNSALWGMDPQAAVEAPRFQSRHPMGIMGHATYPKTIQVEGRVPEEVRKELAEKYGYVVQTSGGWEYIGLMGAIGFDYKNGFLLGGADPRSHATAYGW